MKTKTPPSTDTLTRVISDLTSATATGRSVKSEYVYTTGREHGMTFQAIKEAFLLPAYKAGHGVWSYDKLTLEAVQSALANPAGISHGKYVAPAAAAPAAPVAPVAPAKAFAQVTSITSDEVYVPAVDSTFVPWGEFSNTKKILSSGMFFPVYIAGMSGNGKTFMVEQACARLKREYVRVQISPETDEDDLLGGFRLIDGETVFQKGPVFKAMEQGAVLLIDEIDRGTNKIMCLQSVLEGKPVLVKKTGQTVSPAPGFNVVATANTFGRGSEDGRYVAAQIIDDAFIERFVATIDQPYPSFATEHKIVTKHMEAYEVNDPDFIDKLCAWSEVIRKTFANEGVDEVVSTRRLCHIVKAHSIFANRLKAIEMCVSRFDAETRDAFLDLYTKIDSGELKAETDSEITEPGDNMVI